MLWEYKIIRTSSVIWFTIRHRQQISVVDKAELAFRCALGYSLTI